MNVISIFIPKGGVGKTTLALMLATAIAELGKSVLMIDNEPQADASLCISDATQNDTIDMYYTRELKRESYQAVIQHSDEFGIDYIPASAGLVNVEQDLKHNNGVLRDILGKLPYQYDYIIIDNSPFVSNLVINSLVASDYVIIPTQPSYMSACKIRNVLGLVDRIRRKLNPQLQVLGVVINMMEWRTIFGRSMVSSIKKSYHDVYVFKSMIPNSIRVAEATYLHRKLPKNKRTVKISNAFTLLAKEVLKLG